MNYDTFDTEALQHHYETIVAAVDSEDDSTRRVARKQVGKLAAELVRRGEGDFAIETLEAADRGLDAEYIRERALTEGYDVSDPEAYPDDEPAEADARDSVNMPRWEGADSTVDTVDEMLCHLR